jgi:hypothetical protein
VLEERRSDELVDRRVGAYGLYTNPRPPSLASQIEGFGRVALQNYGECSLTTDMLAMCEERSREEDECHISPRHHPSRRRRMDGLGDVDRNRFTDLNWKDDVDGLRRHSDGKVDPEGAFSEQYRIAD